MLLFFVEILQERTAVGQGGDGRDVYSSLGIRETISQGPEL